MNKIEPNKSEVPLISVIVPNYNHELFLRERLDSIFNQTYPNFEVILLDDCSTDNSQSILLEYAKNPNVSHCILNKTNSGNTFIQWNKGMHLAKGEIIWIAETDDFNDAQFLEEVSKPLIHNSEVVLSYCQSNRVNEKGTITGNWESHTNWLSKNQFENDFILDGNLFIEHYLMFINVIPNASAVLMKRKALLSLGSIESKNDLKYSGDWLLYIKLLVNNKIGYVAKSLNNFRCHSNSVIATLVRNEKKISIIDANLFFRSKMLLYLKSSKPTNYVSILKNNRKVIKELKYEKASLLYGNNKKINGFFVMLSTFPFFLNKYKLVKKSVLIFNSIVSKFK
ncbi:glycosyltransferase family 2 protein [Mariniflexile soesokkakense]|uniref:Glycosyltransferase family 2 protein n=1 Tax=Mariniflexile soesokkakense TaxID=1343160 RepID=A0ABV0A9F8_9FLAO